MSYLGRSAKLSLKAQEKVSFLATAGQTVKTDLSYVPSFVEVYVNGVLLTDTTDPSDTKDYTATNGNSITFTVALLLNDEVTVISLKTFTVADHYNKTEADTLLAAKATNTAVATTNTAVALKAPIASPVFTGNVGVGVTPETDWTSSFDVIQYGQAGVLWANNNDNSARLGMNVKYDGAYKYINTNKAVNLTLDSVGQFVFDVAPSGSADSAISWTTAMTILNNGHTVMSMTGAGNNNKWDFDGSYGAVSNIAVAGNSTRLNLLANGSQIGAIFCTATSTLFNTSSDYRLKTDVQPMTGATARVKLLKPCNFEWISDGTRVDGFLAHEAKEVVPEAVSGTKDAMMDEEYEVTAATDTEEAVMGTRSVPDMQGIDQAKLVPLLTATIQELISRIEALEA